MPMGEMYMKFKTSFPELYKDVYCGWTPEHGWEELLWKLSLDIKKVLDKVGNEDLRREFNVAQVKEKFGGLRFYFDGGNDEIDKLVTEAENKSFEICGNCGAEKSSLRKGGWVRTLCDVCHQKEQNENKEYLKKLKENKNA